MKIDEFESTSLSSKPFCKDPVDAQDYRDAMACLGAAVHVVTTDGAGGRAGFTASSVCSLTDAPASLLVCIQHRSSAYSSVIANGVLCVNTLCGDLEDVSRRFGGKTPMMERFSGAKWGTLKTGSPAHPKALVAFDCVIEHKIEVATHDVLLCRVVALSRGNSSDCLVYAGRRYQRISLP